MHTGEVVQEAVSCCIAFLARTLWYDTLVSLLTVVGLLEVMDDVRLARKAFVAGRAHLGIVYSVQLLFHRGRQIHLPCCFGRSAFLLVGEHHLLPVK